MYPDRESVERLEEDVGQDQAQLAARGLVNREHLAGEEPEPRHHHHADTLTGTDEDEHDWRVAAVGSPAVPNSAFWAASTAALLRWLSRVPKNSRAPGSSTARLIRQSH